MKECSEQLSADVAACLPPVGDIAGEARVKKECRIIAKTARVLGALRKNKNRFSYRVQSESNRAKRPHASHLSIHVFETKRVFAGNAMGVAPVMSDEQEEALVLRGIAHRMSQGIEIKTHKPMVRAFRNTFFGTVSSLYLVCFTYR